MDTVQQQTSKIVRRINPQLPSVRMSEISARAGNSAAEIARCVALAKEPENYQMVVLALEECAELDETLTWTNAAEVLFSMAKILNDNNLIELAVRIKVRAARRLGELLILVNPTGHSQGRGKTSMLATGNSIGLKKGQVRDCVRLARVSKKTFDRLTESSPPTPITQMRHLGRKHDKGERTYNPFNGSDSYHQAMGGRGVKGIAAFALFCEKHNATNLGEGCSSVEGARLRERLKVIKEWVEEFELALA